MQTIAKFIVLDPYVEGADVVDVKVFEGHTDLRAFIAAMLSYYPWWIVWLYRLREILVKALGLEKHAAPEILPLLEPGDVSFEPGENATFFIVRSAKEDVYWIAETPDDKHLRAYFGVLSEPLTETTRRFSVITAVHYKHWTGLVYFNLIRPFHHLVVRQMARAGLRSGQK